LNGQHSVPLALPLLSHLDHGDQRTCCLRTDPICTIGRRLSATRCPTNLDDCATLETVDTQTILAQELKRSSSTPVVEPTLDVLKQTWRTMSHSLILRVCVPGLAAIHGRLRFLWDWKVSLSPLTGSLVRPVSVQRYSGPRWSDHGPGGQDRGRTSSLCQERCLALCTPCTVFCLGQCYLTNRYNAKDSDRV